MLPVSRHSHLQEPEPFLAATRSQLRTCNDDADDDTEESQCRAKDFDHQNLDEERGVLRVRQRCTAANNPHAKPARQNSPAKHSSTSDKINNL